MQFPMYTAATHITHCQHVHPSPGADNAFTWGFLAILQAGKHLMSGDGFASGFR